MNNRSLTGFLLAVALLLLPACATTSAPKKASPASIAVLLKLDGVRQELGITPAQAGILDAIHAGYKQQARNIMAFGEDGDDGALRSEWDIRKLRKQTNARCLAVLTAGQQERLLEIQRQMLGGNLLGSPSEQALLGLSAAQQAQLSAISNSARSQARVINAQASAGQIPQGTMRSRLRGIQEQSSSQMLAVLTPGQKKQWKILSGQKTGMPAIHDPDARTMSLFEGY